ncbi:MAG TPA: glycoside hydrolase family 27 protein [Povalibacter sp.]|nr:glycoside hydrolase family 27 protein [Povalibacter sp.]
MKAFALIILGLLSAAAAAGTADIKFPDLAQTPPMGWNSWNTFGCNIDENLIRQTTDAMVSSGMRDAGYVYVNIDDCWHGERDANGFIQPDPRRFPAGMKALADYVHSRGMKIGIYSDAGATTCGGHPGSQGHEYQDALQYARWGIDLLKYDWCATEDRTPAEAYRTMARALRAAGRPMVFSICEWGDNKPWLWAQPLGHLWRTTGDITNCWDCVVSHGSWESHGVMAILDKQAGLRKYAGPGHWNDPDMMEVGNLPSVNEDRAHFAMWAMLAAPLIAGNDVRTMTAATRAILTNRDVIAIDQDSLGISGFPYRKEAGLEIWFKPLSGSAWAVALLNRASTPQKVQFDWKTEDVQDALNDLRPQFDRQVYSLTELFSHTGGSTAKPLDVTVPARDVLLYRLEKIAQ